MATRDSIVCAVDGGRTTVHLARVAADVSRVLGAPLDLVHVVGAMPDRSEEGGADALWPADPQLAIRAGEGPEADAGRMLQRVARAIGEPGAGRHVVPFGDPGRRVAELAAGWGSPLIVVGTRGNAPVTDALGRVSSRLAADAPCPVLVIPHGLESHVVPLTWRARTLVCGVDGSPHAWDAAARAAELAFRLGGALRVVHVGPGIAADTVRDALAQLRAIGGNRAERDAPSLDVRYEQPSGEPAESSSALRRPRRRRSSSPAHAAWTRRGRRSWARSRGGCSSTPAGPSWSSRRPAGRGARGAPQAAMSPRRIA